MSLSSKFYGRLCIWLTMFTMLIWMLTVGHVSAAPNLAPVKQSSDIPLPNVVFGTDASLALAGDGSVHVAFSPDAPLRVNVYPVQYAYCATNCSQESNWGAIAIGEARYDGGGMRLRLDPQGRPRVMWFAKDIGLREGIYVYAECNQNCLRSTNWKAIGLVSSMMGALNDEEYFTLDPQGRPRFVFQGSTGVMSYASCERSCSEGANWTATPINTPNLEPFNFELVYDRSGRPRISFITQARIEKTFVGFASCDTSCTNAANWSVLSGLVHVGVDYDHSLAVDSQGRPRLAVYTGGYSNGPTPEDYHLLFLWCDAGCIDYTGWFYQQLSLPATAGEDVDLRLDNQDRPRLVYYVRGGKVWSTAWDMLGVQPNALPMVLFGATRC